MKKRKATASLILASASERRRKILAELGLSFKVVRPAVEEITCDGNPDETVIRNAQLKNEWCRRRFPRAVIIAADTIVEFKGRILTKPSSRNEAFEFLRMLSGKTHRVFTGIAFSPPGRPAITITDISKVRFRRLSDTHINDFIARVNPLDRAGAYDIDENGDLLVSSFSGSRTNIMGLSSETVSRLLKKEGLL